MHKLVACTLVTRSDCPISLSNASAEQLWPDWLLATIHQDNLIPPLSRCRHVDRRETQMAEVGQANVCEARRAPKCMLPPASIHITSVGRNGTYAVSPDPVPIVSSFGIEFPEPPVCHVTVSP